MRFRAFTSIEVEYQALSMNKTSWSFCSGGGRRHWSRERASVRRGLLLFYLVWCKLHAIFALDIIYGAVQWTPMTIPIHVVSCYWCHTECKYTNKDQTGEPRQALTQVHTLCERDRYVSVLDVCSSTWLHGTWHELRRKKRQQNIDNIRDAHRERGERNKIQIQHIMHKERAKNETGKWSCCSRMKDAWHFSVLFSRFHCVFVVLLI